MQVRALSVHIISHTFSIFSRPEAELENNHVRFQY
jgi:hypothetical protein